jgi:hypothetical protein
MRIKFKLSLILIIPFFIVFSSVPVMAAYGVRTKTSGCKANQVLQDSRCTPGAVMSTSTAIICKVGYATTVRDVPLSVRKAVFKEYGLSYNNSVLYEVDHLISLELGGSNDISNLFPESYKITNGARVKDVFENYLHKQVCSGAMKIEEAQKQISTDWLKYDNLRKNVKATTTAVIIPITVSTTTVINSAKTIDPQVKKSTTGLCHEKGTRYYNTTKNFKVYNTIKDCLSSGGKLPK